MRHGHERGKGKGQSAARLRGGSKKGIQPVGNMNLVEQVLAGAQPDHGHVLQQLDANEEIIFETIGTLANAVRTQINHNSDALERVDSRIRSSVNGHIRKNLGLLKPVVESLYTAVHNGISETQASLNQAISRPEIQAWLRRQPQSPGWGGVVPAPPAPGDLTDGANGTVSSPAMPSSAAGLTTYYLWYHCSKGQAIAVPNLTAGQQDAFLSLGWKLWPGKATIQVSSEAEAQQYLQSQRAKIARLCAAG